METSSGAVRRLVLMRHAKAEEVGESDLARALSDRGHAEASDAGAWLADWLSSRAATPDHALVSSAVRTRETWAEVVAAAGWELEPDFATALYSAGPEAALDLLRELPVEATTVVVIGHNPTIGYLAQMLADGTSDPEATAAMAGGYPTAAVTVLEHAGEWVELDLVSAAAVAFHAPERA